MTKLPAEPHTAAPGEVPPVQAAAPPAEEPAAPPARTRRSLAGLARCAAVPLGIFAASRAVLVAVLFFAERLPGAGPAARFLDAWDGAWYLSVAEHGYAHAVAAAPTQNNLAFFPLYPLAVRGLHAATALSYQRSALVITVAASALAMVAIWLFVERLTDAGTASRSVALISFFPWAFIFSSAYSEGLLLALAAICLLALLDEKWLIAGLAALLAGAARPNGLVLGLPCAWAALVAIRRRRAWWALIAPGLAPLGILGFFAYLQVHTGDFLANLHARSRGWPYDGIGLHVAAAQRTISAYFAHPFNDLDKLSSLVAMVFIAVALVLMARWRPPAIVWLYVVPIVALAVWFDTYVSMARFALTAFPLLVAVSRPIKGPAFWAVVGVSAALMATLFIFTGMTTLLTP
jgi:hypothetical protein